MRTPTVVFLISLAAALFATGLARAITYGTPDGDAHPYVGLVALYDHGVYRGRCSGALISPTVVLTAAHCVAETGADGARVYFTASVTDDLGAPTGGSTGTPHANEHFTDLGALPNTSDVGVIVLDHPVEGITPAVLAGPGALNGLKGVSLTVVGYGLQGVKPRILDDKTRFRATPSVVRLDGKLTAGWNVETTNDKKSGGTCFGDSGAPLLLAGEVVAVNSFGKNTTCKGHDYSYRIDTTYAQTWLAGFLGT